MALVLNEEQTMLRDSARGLIRDKAPVSHLRQLRDTRDATGFSRDLWREFAEMGFSGLLVPENFGGSGLGCVEAGVVMEEIGRTLMPSPFLASAVLAASALSRGGSAAQKSEYLPKISDGSLLAALAIDEGTKHRPLMTKMQAVRSGNGFRLNGDKAFVVDGHTADLMIVAARTAGAAGERDGLTLFLVDPRARGIATERTEMVDSHNAARIRFDNVEVNADGVLGEVDQGGALLQGVLNIGRAAVASEMVGLSEEELPVAPFSLTGYRVALAGSNIGGMKETQEMLDYCADHDIVSDVEVIGVEQIGAAYERILKSDVKYRFSIDMATLG